MSLLFSDSSLFILICYMGCHVANTVVYTLYRMTLYLCLLTGIRNVTLVSNDVYDGDEYESEDADAYVEGDKYVEDVEVHFTKDNVDRRLYGFANGDDQHYEYE